MVVDAVRKPGSPSVPNGSLHEFYSLLADDTKISKKQKVTHQGVMLTAEEAACIKLHELEPYVK